MVTDPWLWVTLIALLALCCVPMLFMRQHKKQSSHKERTSDGEESSAKK